MRETVGAGEESVSPPAEVTTVTGLLDWLAADSPAHAAAFADRNRLRAAVDQTFVTLDAPIGREVAIFPPVTGG